MNLRLQKLRKLLAEKKLDAVLVSSLPNITYLTNFSGFSTEDRDAYLLITKKQQYIFTHGIYKEAVEQYIKDFTLIDIKRENPISKSVENIIAKEKIKKLGFEGFDLTVNEYEKLTKQVRKKIVQSIDLIDDLRTIKSPEEITAIKKACQLGDKAFDFILSKLKPGISEKETAFALDFFVRRQGATNSFPTIVAFGPNASKPHHVSTDTKLKKNSLVLIDFGVLLNNYCSDMTRTFFVGKATDKQKKVYNTTLESQQEAITFINNKLTLKQKIVGKDADAIARKYIMENGFASIPHSLGHGIGIMIHESPRLTPFSDEILKPGMAFSIEPGIYLPGEFGVRIEDLFAIDNSKLIQLTNAPKKLMEL